MVVVPSPCLAIRIKAKRTWCHGGHHPAQAISRRLAHCSGSVPPERRRSPKPLTSAERRTRSSPRFQGEATGQEVRRPEPGLQADSTSWLLQEGATARPAVAPVDRPAATGVRRGRRSLRAVPVGRSWCDVIVVDPSEHRRQVHAAASLSKGRAAPARAASSRPGVRPLRAEPVRACRPIRPVRLGR
jgi:hypothetical protein